MNHSELIFHMCVFVSLVTKSGLSLALPGALSKLHCKQANSKDVHRERTLTLTWKALLSMCSPSFAPSKFTIICLPYKFLRVWKCLLTEEKIHSHFLAHKKLTATPATLTSCQVSNINFIHTCQQSIERHKQSPGSCQTG